MKQTYETFSNIDYANTPAYITLDIDKETLTKDVQEIREFLNKNIAHRAEAHHYFDNPEFLDSNKNPINLEYRIQSLDLVVTKTYAIISIPLKDSTEEIWATLDV